MRIVAQIVVAACMLAVAGGAWWFFYFEQPQAEGAPGQAAPGAMAVPVETAKVQVGLGNVRVRRWQGCCRA